MYFYSGIFCIIYVTRLDMRLPKPSTTALNVITAFYLLLRAMHMFVLDHGKQQETLTLDNRQCSS